MLSGEKIRVKKDLGKVWVFQKYFYFNTSKLHTKKAGIVSQESRTRARTYRWTQRHTQGSTDTSDGLPPSITLQTRTPTDFGTALCATVGFRGSSQGAAVLVQALLTFAS